MLTQVELVSASRPDEKVAVYWIDHNLDTQAPLRAGRGIRLAESDLYWRVNRVFTTLSRVEDLPVKARIGTIVELN